jgi:hypothetical protein
MAEKEASSVVTSNNAAEFYAERLGLSESVEPTEADDVKKSSEPEQEPEQKEPKAEEEAKEQKPEKQKDKLNKRFDKVTQRAKDAEAKAVDLENRLKEYEARTNQQPQETPKPEGKPQASQFNDAFEYAEALAEWSAENALKQRDAEEAGRKAQKAKDKVLESWNKKIAKAKADLPDFDAMVQSSTVVVSDEIRDSILESDVGAQLLYFLASDEDFAKQLTEMPMVKALREIGKLEAKFEAKEVKTPKAEKQKEEVSRSTAPSPIRPLTGGKVGNDVLLDSNGEFHGTYSQWKAARQAGKVR